MNVILCVWVCLAVGCVSFVLLILVILAFVIRRRMVRPRGTYYTYEQNEPDDPTNEASDSSDEGIWFTLIRIHWNRIRVKMQIKCIGLYIHKKCTATRHMSRATVCLNTSLNVKVFRITPNCYVTVIGKELCRNRRTPCKHMNNKSERMRTEICLILCFILIHSLQTKTSYDVEIM